MKKDSGRSPLEFHLISRWRPVAFLVASLLVAAYLPSLFYLAYRVGITAPIITNTKIMMSAGWFPVLSSESWFGRMVAKGKGQPTIVFAKVRTFQPLWDKMMAVSFAPEVTKAILSRNDVVAKIKRFSWGKAYFIQYGSIPLTGQVFVVVPSYQLTISAPDSIVIDEITNISLVPSEKSN